MGEEVSLLFFRQVSVESITRKILCFFTIQNAESSLVFGNNALLLGIVEEFCLKELAAPV